MSGARPQVDTLIGVLREDCVLAQAWLDGEQQLEQAVLRMRGAEVDKALAEVHDKQQRFEARRTLRDGLLASITGCTNNRSTEQLLAGVPVDCRASLAAVLDELRAILDALASLRTANLARARQGAALLKRLRLFGDDRADPTYRARGGHAVVEGR